MTREPTAYWDYIKVEELLALQSGIETTEEGLSNDEVLFITIHQIDELWFKLALRELDSLCTLFGQEHVPEQSLSSVARGVRRVALIFKKAAEHFELMETMTPRDYLAFRDKLNPASGFQSAQMREIEILLGLTDEDRIAYGHETSYRDALRAADGSDSSASLRVKRRLEAGRSLRNALGNWLYRTPIDGSLPDDENDAGAQDVFISQYLQSLKSELDRALGFALHDNLPQAERDRLEKRYAAQLESARAYLMADDIKNEGADDKTVARKRRIRLAILFIESYRELPLLAWPRAVLDACVQMEQAMIVFRQRHARMVERIIGRRTGTGGSAGVDYLDKTALAYRVFDDLWAVRSLQVRKSALPRLRHSEHYALAVD